MTHCAHDHCRCVPPAGQRYCGDYCRKASGASGAAEAFDMPVCNCGHLDCMRGKATHDAPGSAAPGSTAIDSKLPPRKTKPD